MRIRELRAGSDYSSTFLRFILVLAQYRSSDARLATDRAMTTVTVLSLLERTHTALAHKLFVRATPTAHLRGRIGPAHLGRENDLDIAADRVAHAGAKLERLQSAAWHRELIDGLRALIPLAGDARDKPIVGLRPGRRVKPHVLLRPHRDLDRFTPAFTSAAISA